MKLTEEKLNELEPTAEELNRDYDAQLAEDKENYASERMASLAALQKEGV